MVARSRDISTNRFKGFVLLLLLLIIYPLLMAQLVTSPLVWTAPSTEGGAGTMGELQRRLDATVSSRASAADYTAARAAKLDNLDVLVSSRATAAGVWSEPNTSGGAGTMGEALRDNFLRGLKVSPKTLEVFPNFANAVVVPASPFDWRPGGSFVEIIPANAITSDFVITHIQVRINSTVDTQWQLVLGLGPAGSEVAKVNVKGVSIAAGLPATFMEHIIPVDHFVDANTRVSAKLSTSPGGKSAQVNLYVRRLSL